MWLQGQSTTCGSQHPAPSTHAPCKFPPHYSIHFEGESLVISHLSSHCQIPPIMNISSYHQLLLISISHPQVESRSRACSLLRRAAPDATATRQRRPGARRAGVPGDRRRQVAGGSRLCARCLCTPLRAMPPHHYILRSSTSPPQEFLPRRHCECEVPSLGRFQPRSDGWVGLVASPLLLRLRTQASPDACGRRLQAGRP